MNRTKKMSLSLVAIILLFLTNSLSAANSGKIAGVVVDAKDGEPLPSVNVMVDDGFTGTFTNDKGEYFIINLPPRKYKVTFRLMGYKNQTMKDVQVITDKTVTINARLADTTLIGDDQVVIVKRDFMGMDEPVDKKVYTKDDLKHKPVDNINDIAATEPGIVCINNQLYIRGSRQGVLSVLIDGVEVRDVIGGPNGISQGNLTATSLQEMQIFKGGVDAEYGNIDQGVLKVTTREGDIHTVQGNITYWTDDFRAPELNKYSDNYDRLSFAMGGPEPWLSEYVLPALGIEYFHNKLSYFISIDISKQDGQYSFNDYAPTQHQRSYQTNSILGMSISDRQYNNYQVQTKLTFKPTAGMKLTLNYSGQWDNYNPYTSWEYRYTPGTSYYVKESSSIYSLTFNQQLNTSTFYEVILSRYKKTYLQTPDNPYDPGNGLYPDDFLQWDQWEYYQDVNGNGVYDTPEPFINVTGDTIYPSLPHYTAGDALGIGDIWINANDLDDIAGKSWEDVRHMFDTVYWDWDNDGFIDNSDGEAYVDLNGNGRWDTGDNLLHDSNGDGIFNPERGQMMNVDRPEPYVDGDISLGEPFIDINNNGRYEKAIDIFVMSSNPNENMDWNHNSQYDSPDSTWTVELPYEDLNGNNLFDNPNGRYDYGEPFVDLNHNGKWDAQDGFFDKGYDQYANYHEHMTIVNTLDFKIVKQVIPELEVKSGLQFKYNELHMADLQYPHYPYDGDADDGLWPEQGVFRDFYEQYPYQAAMFTSSKLEFGSLIAILGIRMDLFRQSDNVDDLVAADLEGKEKISTRTKISPRVGVSYPITEKAKVYFNYGHYHQLPNYDLMYRQATQASNAFGIVGNFNLDYKKNISYECGVTYTLSENYILDFAGFYRDVFGQVNSQRKTYGPFQRNEYENSDYSRARGLELELRKVYGSYITGSLGYTYSFAYGKSSSESSNYFDDFYNRMIPIQETPLRWDIRHQLTLNLSLRLSKSDTAELFGWQIPNDWGMSVIWQFNTGRPFTPTRDYPGLKLLPGENPLNNSMRMKPTSNVDLRFYKNFELVGVDYAFEIWINNLFDTRNINGVHSSTGRPDTGTNISGQVKEGSDYSNSPMNYLPGRNIRIGITMSI
jgi:outer membrane receptor protein involved in Fe transport